MKSGSAIVETLIGLVLIMIVITLFFTMTTFIFEATRLTEDTTKIYSFVVFVQDYLSKFRMGHVIDTKLSSKINELFWGSKDPRSYPRIESLTSEDVKLDNATYRRIVAKIKLGPDKVVERVFLIGF